MANPNPTHVGALRSGDVFNRQYPIAGAFRSPSYTYTGVPTASTASSVANFATVSGSSWTVAAGPNATTVVIGGVSYVDLGMARVVTATGSTGSAVATNITVNGLEEMVQLDGSLSAGLALTQTFSGPTGTATTATTKTFRYIESVTTDGNTVGPVGIGHGNTIGFPYKVPYFGAVQVSYDATAVTASTGFTAPDTTSPATAVTGDVRGTYALQSAPNGAKRVVATIWLNDPDTTSGIYGTSQYSA